MESAEYCPKGAAEAKARECADSCLASAVELLAEGDYGRATYALSLALREICLAERRRNEAVERASRRKRGGRG